MQTSISVHKTQNKDEDSNRLSNVSIISNSTHCNIDEKYRYLFVKC